MMAEPLLRKAVFRDPERPEGWRALLEPLEAFSTADPHEVPRLLGRAAEAARGGLWAAGCVAYEAAPAFDRANAARPPESRVDGLPVAAFLTARTAVPWEPPEPAPAYVDESTFVVGAAAPEHAAAVAAIRDAIAAGDVYQVNFTFGVDGRYEGAAEALFARLAVASRAPYAAFLDFGDRAALSLSPELFFSLDGRRVVMRPMKGTRPRGRWSGEDDALAAELAASAKDRAENLMIVDMARNDLGRVALPGSVRVASLCDVERYPSVWQMTSTVEAETEAGLAEIFAALFPCASVTGAPRSSAMRAIATREPKPRGVYCGAVGWVAPESPAETSALSAASAPSPRATFSVAIRTATLVGVGPEGGTFRYGVGSGIVWDSDPAAEYAECLVKARALAGEAGPAELFETLRWRPATGFVRLDRHLARLRDSARYWEFECDDEALRAALARAVAGAPAVDHRVRLELETSGRASAVASRVEIGRPSWRAVLATEPVDSTSRRLFHKTTDRSVYDRALAEAREHGADEALLWNERGELTEGTRSSLFLRLDGEWRTPALECGLLPGILRARLLERGSVREARIPKEELLRATGLFAGSSLRGLVPLELA